MKTFVLPYVRYVVSPPRAKRLKYVYRPVVPVTVGFGKQAITFDALVDSGADECTFPAWIVKTVFYSHDWDDMPFGLLGQAGFFAHFDVMLSYTNREIRFRRR